MTRKIREKMKLHKMKFLIIIILTLSVSLTSFYSLGAELSYGEMVRKESISDNETEGESPSDNETEGESPSDNETEGESPSDNEVKEEKSSSDNETGEDETEEESGEEEFTEPVWIRKKPSVKLKRATHDGFILTLTTKGAAKVNKGKLYYKIIASPLDVRQISGNHSGEVVFYHPFEAEVTEVFIQVNEHGQGKEKYKITVTLVQTKDKEIPGKKAEEGGNIIYETASGKEGKINSVTTKIPKYETKLTLKKKVNRIYQGQNDVVAAESMFTVNTTYVTLEEAYLHSAPGVWDADNPPADISFTKKGDIIISVKKDAIPGTYVIAAVPKTEQGVHKLPAYMKIEVARSINELEIKAPLSIFKQEGKKAVFKTEIVYNNGIEYFMPKTKKVTYTLYDDKGKEITKDHTLYGMITIKNGKVTLHKNYNPKEALIFTIEASAADYKENEVKATAAVLVQRVPISMEKACIVKKIGENKYAPITVDQATGNVLARELHQSRIVVLKNHVSDNSVYTEEDFMENNFTFKSSKGKAVSVDEEGNVEVLKTVKNLKLTVTADDGSKAAYVFGPMEIRAAEAKELELSVSMQSLETGAYEQLSLENNFKGNGGSGGITSFIGAKDMLFYVDIINSEDGKKEFFANHTLKVRGGKFVSKNSSGSYIISASSQNIILELTNTTTGKIKTYELFNAGFGEAKTVKVTTSNKVTAYTAGKQTVTYKIPNEDIGKYSYVMVTPDMVQKEKNEEPAILQSLSLKSIGTPIEISGKSTFDLVVEQTTDEHGVYVEILPFHYKFNITFGYLNEKNQFIAETKPLPVSLMVKEPGKTKTQVLSLKKQYTMGEMGEDITLQLNKKGKIIMLYGLTNDNIKGKSSDMTDSFVLEGNSLRLKESISGNGSLQGKYSGWIEGGLYMDDQGQIGYIEPVKITVKK